MSDTYALQFSDRALTSLKRLERPSAKRILDKLEWLAMNARLVAHAPLTGEWSGYYRLRVGDYRAIYSIEHEQQQIRVEIIGHRREIYD